MRFTARVAEIEAVQWTGDNIDEIAYFVTAPWQLDEIGTLTVFAGQDSLTRDFVKVLLNIWITKVGDHFELCRNSTFVERWEEPPMSGGGR